MDFCDNKTVAEYVRPTNSSDSAVNIKLWYSYSCPFLLFACFVSVLLNGFLVVLRKSPLIRNTPIIVISLNLATTDGLASLFTVFGITVNSYLPVVYGIEFNKCWLLVLEILRLSAFVASVLHLLALTWLHYQGIVNPLQHRASTLTAQLTFLRVK
ncbi:Trace amine-associated receptor 2-like protein [Dinothrombium tinctorium]|uniref:Trace amine-associated receptor 2-like protein n=1 Tax=Dinothrombium tinctorium TaxID=1965070 RepID=A0A443QR51_9ACAR|nr:Trace amine-associated receptor 2-like protein [Dinothrombium tinctorium]